MGHVPQGDEIQPRDGSGQGEDNIFEIEDRAFVQAILTGDHSLVKCTYAQAYHAHQVTMAANASLESGMPEKIVVG